MTRLSIIVAMANNRTIGRNNKLPWYLPQDLQYFKRITMGKPIIMGRKTFESIGHPLPGRINIVVTRQQQWTREGVRVAHSTEEAIQLADSQAVIDGVDEVMLIGGAELYRSALPAADTVYLTHVNADIEGDAFFPELDNSLWQEVHRQSFPACDNNPHDYAFCVLQRRRTATGHTV